jgi:hypothetical protein
MADAPHASSSGVSSAANDAADVQSRAPSVGSSVDAASQHNDAALTVTASPAAGTQFWVLVAPFPWWPAKVVAGLPDGFSAIPAGSNAVVTYYQTSEVGFIDSANSATVVPFCGGADGDKSESDDDVLRNAIRLAVADSAAQAATAGPSTTPDRVVMCDTAGCELQCLRAKSTGNKNKDKVYFVCPKWSSNDRGHRWIFEAKLPSTGGAVRVAPPRDAPVATRKRDRRDDADRVVMCDAAGCGTQCQRAKSTGIKNKDKVYFVCPKRSNTDSAHRWIWEAKLPKA